MDDRQTADRDRTAVYAAEAAAFDGTDLESIVGFDRVAAAMRRVIGDSWWSGPAATIQPSRRDARSSSTRCEVSPGAAVTIRIAGDQATLATGAHELAHALAGPAHGHDARFRAAYLDLIAVITNLDSADRRRGLHVDQLARAFDAAQLGIGERAWPWPPSTAVGPIAL